MCENDGLMVQWFLSSFGYTMYARTFHPEPDNRIQRHSHITIHILDRKRKCDDNSILTA